MQEDRILVLRNSNRIWAVGAIMGEYDRLRELHEGIEKHFEAGDKIIYLGNYFGNTGQGGEVLKELLDFRCWALATGPFMHLDDVVFLSGRFEQMWIRAASLHNATDAASVLDWMLANGFAGILNSYHLDVDVAKQAANLHGEKLKEWTQSFKQAIRQSPGHSNFIGALKWMALTREGSLLFVSSGFDPHRPLTEQAQMFWWTQLGFDTLNTPYRTFKLVVRGFDKHASTQSIMLDPFKLSVDSGSGRNGKLSAVCLDSEGKLLNHLMV